MLTEQQVLKQAYDLIDRSQLGFLTTIDREGYPHSRWMAAAAENGLKKLLTTTAEGTRKLAHIEANPKVSWFFSSADQQDIVLVKGNAEVHRNALEMQEVWERLAAATQQFAANSMSADEDLSLVVIETNVTSVEIISPRQEVFKPQVVPLTA